MMRNKYLILLTSAILAPMSVFAADGDVFTYNDLKYKVLSETDKTCEVSDNAGTTGDVVIPETAENNGESYRVTEIGVSAFAACRTMKSISIPESVVAIRERGLENCSGLETLVIPNSVTVIEYRGIFGCSGLTSLTLSNNLKEIAPSTCSGCNYITELTIPDSVEKIGDEAFNFCGRITALVLGKNLKEIGVMSFAGCYRLNALSIPASVTTIGREAFSYCERLKNVTIEASEGILTFGEEVFGQRTYKDSWAPIERVTINRDYSCMSATPNAQPFSYLSTLNTVTIGDQVTSIPASSFSNNSSLTRVEIGADVSNIGVDAFAGCSKLVEIDVKAPVPPTVVSSSFDNYSYGNANLRVPESSLNSYKEHSVWKQFTKISGQDWPGIIDYTVEISQQSAAVKVDETVVLSVIINPEKEPASVVWTSSDTGIATVDEKGVVTGVAQGNATITAEVTIPNVETPYKVECAVSVTGNNNINMLTDGTAAIVEAYRTDGSFVFKGSYEQLRSLESGLYIVRSNKGVCKIVIK